MTKSTKRGKVVYNFLDSTRDNIEIYQDAWLENGVIKYKFLVLELEEDTGNQINITQETAKDLIKVLQEFAQTGELK